MASDTLSILRKALLATLLFGSAGSILELLLIQHDEDVWQYIPLALIGISFLVAVWHLARRDAASVRALQLTMVLFILAGALGVVLHFNGAAEFQREIDPTQDRWSLLGKVLRAKAPPVLAPGLMVQLGLLGLLYSFRHPALARRDAASQPGHREVTS